MNIKDTTSEILRYSDRYNVCFFYIRLINPAKPPKKPVGIIPPEITKIPIFPELDRQAKNTGFISLSLEYDNTGRNRIQDNNAFKKINKLFPFLNDIEIEPEILKKLTKRSGYKDRVVDHEKSQGIWTEYKDVTRTTIDKPTAGKSQGFFAPKSHIFILKTASRGFFSHCHGMFLETAHRPYIRESRIIHQSLFDYAHSKRNTVYSAEWQSRVCKKEEDELRKVKRAEEEKLAEKRQFVAITIHNAKEKIAILIKDDLK